MSKAIPSSVGQELLRVEFNRWAEAGRGEEMESHHVPIVVPLLELMNLQPDERVLDLGCGSGWLVKRLAALLAQGSVTGVDVSDEMVRHAQAANAGVANVQILRGSAEQIPAANGAFTRVISVESSYYWHDPGRGLGEIFRVLDGGGSAWILINYYLDNPDCHQWKEHYRVTTHLLSAAEWQDLFLAAGFRQVSSRRIPDLSPSPEVYTGIWFKDAAQLLRMKLAGALLVTGVKP